MSTDEPALDTVDIVRSFGSLQALRGVSLTQRATKSPPCGRHAIKAAEARRPEVKAWIIRGPTTLLAAVTGGALPAEERVEGLGRRAPFCHAYRTRSEVQPACRSCGTGACDRLRPHSRACDDDVIGRFLSEIAGSGMGRTGSDACSWSNDAGCLSRRRRSVIREMWHGNARGQVGYRDRSGPGFRASHRGAPLHGGGAGCAGRYPS